MHNLHAYNPTLEKNVIAFIQGKDWEGLSEFFSKLSHSEFRTLGKMMSDTILPRLDENDYWDVFDFLFESHPKAWLVTLLKAAVKLYGNNQLHFDQERFKAVCCKTVQENRLIDERKILQTVLPVLKTPQEVSSVFQFLLLDGEADKCIRYLLLANTLPCYYILFQKMRHMDGQTEKLSLYCAELLRKNDDRSFNLVSIIKHYFDLPAVKGTFSLKINPYELSRLDSSYSGFCQMITRI